MHAVHFEHLLFPPDGGHEPVELVVLLVPLDRVQLVALQVVVAGQEGRLPPQFVDRNGRVHELQTL